MSEYSRGQHPNSLRNLELRSPARKVRKHFTLEPETIEWLSKQPNASTAIDQLIRKELLMDHQQLTAEEFFSQISECGRHQLQRIEEAIHWRYMDLYTGYLNRHGFNAVCKRDKDDYLDYILVSHDSDPEPESATIGEADALLSIVQNLSSAEAWQRWVWKKDFRIDDRDWESVATQLKGTTPEDRQSERSLVQEVNRDLRSLKDDRRRLQQEFLQRVEAEGLSAVESQWVPILTELGDRYRLGRNVVRDAVDWALKNQHRFS